MRKWHFIRDDDIAISNVMLLLLSGMTVKAHLLIVMANLCGTVCLTLRIIGTQEAGIQGTQLCSSAVPESSFSINNSLITGNENCVLVKMKKIKRKPLFP